MKIILLMNKEWKIKYYDNFQSIDLKNFDWVKNIEKSESVQIIFWEIKWTRFFFNQLDPFYLNYWRPKGNHKHTTLMKLVKFRCWTQKPMSVQNRMDTPDLNPLSLSIYNARLSSRRFCSIREILILLYIL